MLLELKTAQGFDYTNKMQRMFQDIKLSKDAESRYKNQFAEESNKIDLHILVLCAGFWPFTTPPFKLQLPKELDQVYTNFGISYNKLHDGRTLSPLYQLCRAEVVTHYLKHRYIFVVHLYSLCILLLYNQGGKTIYTQEEIQQQTGLDSSTLQSQLNLLTKAKILNDDLSLNLNYKGLI